MSEHQAKKARREAAAMASTGIQARNPDELEIKTPSGNEYDIQPLNGYVLARELKPEERTPGGLFIPEHAQAKMPMMEVLKAGAGMFAPGGSDRLPCEVKPGDRILVSPQLGAVFELPDHAVKTAVLSQQAIFAIVSVKPRLDA